ncbi:peptidase C39 family protein [Actinobacteria bacterium YIM 96077]|uniref:Peptidase C39 family protein n=1 Tax=Phytoactinopolyspora halophila TaxID=1981511 RepID=A0A329QFB5_9ACTN|nr:peptidase C39 family protein [Phytoactinopolyspora halophila]AYY14093.1 peptidase C39 family protein [Actinobacteria bacterium YIM 96077]RAW11000.1 peptidase C39 family protein [Phytoactinopolyspora halophila]
MHPATRPRILVAGIVVLVASVLAAQVAAHVAGAPVAVGASEPTGTPEEREQTRVDVTRWKDREGWRAGEAKGTTPLPGRAGIIMTYPAGTIDDAESDRTSGLAELPGTTDTWEYATWTTPLTELPFGATELIASWNASTPGQSWLSVDMQGTYGDGTTTPWYTLGHWTDSPDSIDRTSVDGQGDGRSRIDIDTFTIDSPDEPSGGNRGVETGTTTTATGQGEQDGQTFLEAYQLRVTMYRPAGSSTLPRVWMLGAMASDVPARSDVEPSSGGIAWGHELAVPRRSTAPHRDEHPGYRGTQAWSGAAAVTMVMEYFDVVPSRTEMSWIDAGYKDPQVAHAARMTWDHALDGTGNWSFNTAYAASLLGLDAFVTRLGSLDDVEVLIDAGVPVVTSVSFRESELDGSGYSAAGHLMVVTGFTEDGDVVVNDPRALTNASARRVYDRRQFEQVWLRTRRQLAGGEMASGPGGIVYIVKPRELDLPEADTLAADW